VDHAKAQEQRRLMKVVSVMTSGVPGGGEFAAVNMLEALSARGHQSVMLTDQLELAVRCNLEAREIDLGPKLSRSSYRGLLARWPLLLARLRGELEHEWPYDVLLVHFKKEQLLAACLPQRLRAMLVWAEWGPVPNEMRTGLGRRAYVAAARHTDVVMAVSAATRESLRGAGMPAERIHVVPNALRVDDLSFNVAGRERVRREHGIPADAPVVGCISRFHPKKRNDVVVDAVVRLRRADVHLVMAGEGSSEADLRRRARPLGERAHFLPAPGRDLANVCSTFDVSVFCPSPTEGAPLAVIHSMLAARPCVATASEGVDGLIVPGAGTVVSPEHDAAAVADVLRQYLHDAPRRVREGAVARSIAERLCAAPAVAARIERLLLNARR